MNELAELIENYRKSLDEATFYVKAYKYTIDSFKDVLEGYQREYEELETDIKSGVRGYGVMKTTTELNAKMKLISEVICFMTTALDDAKKGDIE